MWETIVEILFHLVYVYDFLTYPIYWILQRPDELQAKRQEKISTLEYQGSDRVLIRSKPVYRQRQNLYYDSDGTFPSFFKLACQAYKDRKCIGYRKVLRKFQGTFEGKPVTKISKSNDIESFTFQEMYIKFSNMASGLITELDLKKGQPVLILGNTRFEWALSAFGTIMAGGIVSTMVPISPDNVLVYGLKQILPAIIIVEEEFLGKIVRVLRSNPDIPFPKIVCMDKGKTCEDVALSYVDEIEKKGRESPVDLLPSVKPSDPLLIMYTSGTTSHSKGVVVSHEGILNCALNAMLYAVHFLDSENNYTSLNYLPSCHISAFVIYIYKFYLGSYQVLGTPYTLTDNSPSVVEGEKGDLAIAKPYYIGAVPLLLIKIKDGIEKKVASKGPVFKALFDCCVKYKIGWLQKGFTTPILDRLLFSRIRQAFGGKLRRILSGGAPLPADVQLFCKAVVCDFISQGYGATEGSGPLIAQYHDTTVTNDVGNPAPNVEVMIESWEDGEYRVSDPQGPSGELLISGKCLALEYFKHDDPFDNVAFFHDKDGKKWVRTGDIARVNLKTNTLSIIDRKKQLMKLLNGKYVGIGRIETILAESKFVLMACVLARPLKNGVIAVVIPKNLGVLAKDEASSNEKAILDHWAVEFESLLMKHEIPKAICLVDGPWTPETGLVTAAMKIRRHMIEKHYQNQVDKLFDGIN